MTVPSAHTICISDALGQPGIYWTRHAESPYLRGTPEFDFNGPFDLETHALEDLQDAYPGATYLGRLPASNYVTEKEYFWETVTALYKVSFWLPLDELSDQFDVEALTGCPLSNSLTSQVTLQHEPRPTELIVHTIEPYQYGSLMCDSLARNPKDADGPRAEMHLVMKVCFSMPDSLKEDDVFRNAHFKVAIPPYYEEAVPATLEFWDTLLAS